jgi:aryl-alcohol dehydrogenase-like predicted oxidoreductase
MIRQLGLSNVSASQLSEARVIAPIASVQNAYNLEDRSSEAVLQECERLGIAFIPWYPLGAGASLRSDRLKRVAARHGATAAQVALAWLLARSPAMLAIPGTSSIVHLEQNVQAAQLQLDARDRAALD